MLCANAIVLNEIKLKHWQRGQLVINQDVLYLLIMLSCPNDHIMMNKTMLPRAVPVVKKVFAKDYLKSITLRPPVDEVSEVYFVMLTHLSLS